MRQHQRLFLQQLQVKAMASRVKFYTIPQQGCIEETLLQTVKLARKTKPFAKLLPSEGI